MAEERSKHWTEDEELLERFVLGRLAEDEKARLSAHLAACSDCSRKVANETRIAAAAKFSGRKAIKDRLKVRLSSRKTFTATQRTGMHWTRVASLAAVLALLIAVGVYNNWFNTQSWNKQVTDQIVQEQPTSHQEPEAVARNESLAGTRRSDKGIESPVGREREKGRQLAKESPEGLTTEKSNRPSDQDLSRSRSSGKAAAGRSLAKDERQDAGRIAPLADQDNSAERGVWVEGNVISPIAQSAGAEESKLYAAPEATQLKATSSKVKKDNYAFQANNLAFLQQQGQVSQQPISSLPPIQRLQQVANTVQAFITQREDSLYVTLYPDIPLPDSQLRQATIESVSADSIIVDLQSQRIGYKLPFILQTRVGRKATQTK